MPQALATQTHRIPSAERLIVALDVADVDAAKALVTTLGDSVTFYKIGLELAMTEGYFPLLRWLVERDKRVFADLKLHDIPATVGAAVRQLAGCGAQFLTVHGERSVMEAAAEHKGPDLRILAVTVLTSIAQSDLTDVGITVGIDALASARARQAVAAGCDGVVASGLEAARLRAELGPGPLIVTPGIRPGRDRGTDDQKRVVTPREAFERGADYIVVGRPVRAADDPRRAAMDLQAEIAAALQ